MPYDPNANPYIINPLELPANQTAAGMVPAVNKGTSSQWCSSPFTTPNWNDQGGRPPVGTNDPGSAAAQAKNPCASVGVAWPDTTIADRDVAAKAALNAEKTRLSTLDTGLQSQITAINGLLTGAAVISSITPNTGPVAGGTVVTINGSNLTGSTGVTFGGTAGTAFSVVNDGEITVTTPAKAAGAVNVVVANPSGNGTLTNGFTYGVSILQVAPAAGSIAGNTVVTIYGSNFTGSTGVTFGGTLGTAFTVVSDTQITVTTPAHAAGAVNVVVNNPNGNGTLTAGYTYA